MELSTERILGCPAVLTQFLGLRCLTVMSLQWDGSQQKMLSSLSNGTPVIG